MPNLNRPNYRAYKDLAEAVKRKGKRNDWPCHICNRPIDYALHWKDPMSYTYDHDVPFAVGGNIRGTGKPAHRACNSRRGAGNVVKNVQATNVGYDFTRGPNVASSAEPANDTPSTSGRT